MGALQSRTPTVAHQLRTVDLRSDEHAVETKWGRHGSAVRSPTAHLDLRWCAQETFNRSIDAVISRVRSHRDLSECFGMSQRLSRFHRWEFKRVPRVHCIAPGVYFISICSISSRLN